MTSDIFRHAGLHLQSTNRPIFRSLQKISYILLKITLKKLLLVCVWWGGGHLDLSNDGRYFPSRRVTSPIYKYILSCRDENIGLLGVVITHSMLLQY